MSSYYRSLDIVGIRNTIERLSMRIHERFANSGLYKVSQELQILPTKPKPKSSMSFQLVLANGFGPVGCSDHFRLDRHWRPDVDR
ncbi:MAG: hypothetical protein R3A45_08880 [Bdellovibrionota bacterium]